MELLEKLGINWALLLAQAVNFGIVLGALTWLVYRPLLNLLDQRSEKIRRSLEDAAKIESQKKEMDEFRLEQMKKIDAEIGAVLERARREAEEARQQILTGAQEEAARILARGGQKLEGERKKVLSDVQGTVAAVIVRMTEKLLGREWTPVDQKKRIADLTAELPSALT